MHFKQCLLSFRNRTEGSVQAIVVRTEGRVQAIVVRTKGRQAIVVRCDRTSVSGVSVASDRGKSHT